MNNTKPIEQEIRDSVREYIEREHSINLKKIKNREVATLTTIDCGGYDGDGEIIAVLDGGIITLTFDKGKTYKYELQEEV